MEQCIVEQKMHLYGVGTCYSRYPRAMYDGRLIIPIQTYSHDSSKTLKPMRNITVALPHILLQ